jgi:hypothetical protein
MDKGGLAPPHKFSDYSVHKRKGFDKFNISLKFFKIEFKIDKKNILMDKN